MMPPAAASEAAPGVSPQPPYARGALLGTGYIGGSLALALSHARRVGRWVGYDADPGRRERARALGIVAETAASAAAAVAGADLVVLSVPVLAGPAVLAAAAAALAPATLVVDVGSTKSSIVAASAGLPRPGRFLGCHPIAGFERTGPEVADVNLFRGRVCVLTPVAASAPETIEAAAALWRSAGARVVQMDPGHHDLVFAAVSHLPHVVAYSLIGTIATLGGEVGRDVVGMSGAGLRDTTRIASSDPEMWRSIFLDNRAALLGMVDAFGATVATLRDHIAAGDGDALVAFLARAREARSRLLEQP
jgi:prephenate dehydrogenase